jgi:hypothetical protein
MEIASSPWVALTAYPGTSNPAALGVTARVQLHDSGATLRYALQGDLSRLQIPPPQSAERADGLWKHTCFEAFLRAPGKSDYLEFNVSPSRQWSVYGFDSYRHGMSSPEVAPPEISVQRFDDRLSVDVALHVWDLIARRDAPRLELGLSAVIEEEDGRLSYWALKHAPDRPDFHFPGGFALELGT